jgi:uncharacterized membrane protein
MKEWLSSLSEQAVVAIDGIALLVILAGTVEAVIGMLRIVVARNTGHEMRSVWMHYARWLSAALTLQLAADIIETSYNTSWEAVARVGAVTLIRTFLNFFLERDMGEIRERDRESRQESRP